MNYEWLGMHNFKVHLCHFMFNKFSTIFPVRVDKADKRCYIYHLTLLWISNNLLKNHRCLNPENTWNLNFCLKLLWHYFIKIVFNFPSGSFIILLHSMWPYNFSLRYILTYMFIVMETVSLEFKYIFCSLNIIYL